MEEEILRFLLVRADPSHHPADLLVEEFLLQGEVVARLRLAEVVRPAVLLRAAAVVPGQDGTERATIIVEGGFGKVLCYHEM